MAKPVIFTLDDEITVLRAVERDLLRKYGKDYRVLAQESGLRALDAVNELKRRGQGVALFLVDQRMPDMTGVQFLEQAMEVYPEARRVLLTAYADTDAAIQAINLVRLDHYLMKPWDPPEEQLYPVLDDLLGDWQANFRPPFEGVRVVGFPWSPAAHEVKEFLARNLIPFQWLDAGSDGEAQRLLKAADQAEGGTPLVVFPDGSHLVRPSVEQVAEKIGLKQRAGQPVYDLIVVGAGPAGLSAAVYGASEGLKTLLIEAEAPGGQAGGSARIENYLGFPAGLSGADLTRRAVAQAVRFGVEMLSPQQVTALTPGDFYHQVTLKDSSSLTCRVLLIASGVSYRKLEADGMERLVGAGAYYGSATIEAVSCQGKKVVVAGGGNSAGQAAMYLARFASEVAIVIRGPSLVESMSAYLIEQIESTPNIRLMPYTQITAVQGENSLEAVTLKNLQTAEEAITPADSLFIYIGAQPRTEWLKNQLLTDEQGYILTGADTLQKGKRPASWKLERNPFWLESSVPGVFVAGDVRHGSVKRIASGVGEGAMAVQFIHQYLSL
jgi:thioredoxin reductase (NADPH)